MSSFGSTALLTTYLLTMISLKYALQLKISRSFSKVFRSGFSVRSLSGASKEALPTGSDEAYFEKLDKHQRAVPKISIADEVRNLVATNSGHGTLATNSIQYPGFPTGSVVEFVLDEDGLPIFSLSTMSAHTKEIVTDKRASLVVTAKDFQTIADGRITMIGEVSKVTDDALKSKFREIYLKKHTNSYWIDFGDFSFFKMNVLHAVRLVGGFARAGSINGDAYLQAKVDPLATFAVPIMRHMNEDHEDSLVAMIQHFVGIPVSQAKLIALDRLGMLIEAKLAFADKSIHRIRLPFPREVTERKAVKDVVIEMSQAATTGPSSQL